MVVKNRSISHLIEDQLPEFIVTDYPQFARFLEKYYEQVESRGQPFDILNNLEAYRDIDYYEESLLKERSPLVGIINNTDSTIEVEDASSFPEKNGYLKIDDEICFYKKKQGNLFLEVSRGVSGNTKLGDLYESSEFVTTQAESHSGTDVYNISNLFLYALIKKFEYENLNSFPEKYLKKEIDKRTLIKNISNFYKVKGTESSIKFIFNTIVARDTKNVPSTYNPKDFTIKSSTSDWLTTYSLKVVIASGDVGDLIGNRITQNNAELGFASAVVDNVQPIGGADGQQVYQIILNPETVNGNFRVAAKTELEEAIPATTAIGDTVTVQSTTGWGRFGSFLVNNETFRYNDKNVKQFTLLSRSGSSAHAAGTKVYDYSPAVYRDVELIVFGVLYDLKTKSTAPYSSPNDTIEVTPPGFRTRDRVIYDSNTGSIRWKVNSLNTSPTALTNEDLQPQLQKYIGNVLAIYEDSQFYYICSSGYPLYDILSASDTGSLSDSKNLKVIRKTALQTTEIYETTNTSVGVFVDGTIAYSYRDEDFVKFGQIEKAIVTQKGSGYKKAPYVLINNQKGKARAFLSGETLDRIEISDTTTYSSDPEVTIVSGRNAEVRAIVTNGAVTKLVIDNPGEYYSSPPIIRITDRSGRGKFASFNAIISEDGQIVDFERIETGRLYTQKNIFVEVIPEGKFAEARVEIRRWVKNRYQNSSGLIDSANGRLFDNPLTFDQKQYGIIANPVKLRQSLSDNGSGHSPILGYAYDGNPIYGPFGYSDPGDPESSVVRMSTGYHLNAGRSGGPAIAEYPMGSFIDDYTWTINEDTGKTRLDENNGRYCVTPEYPEGTYAYFITIDVGGTPAFPYILGQKYYSLPIQSNYDNSLIQDDLPSDARRLITTSNIDANGFNTAAQIRATKKGSVSGGIVSTDVETFSIGSQVVIDDSETTGFGAYATVSEVKGKTIDNIESVQTKAVKITTSQLVYFFDGDTIVQENTGATGTVVGNSFNTFEFLLRNVTGQFDSSNKISSNNTVVNVIVDQESEYTKGSTVSLFDGIDSVIANSEVLESIKDQNSVRLKVTDGAFISDPNYSLFSSTLSDTSGSKVLSVISLSNGIDVFTINDNVVAVTTEEDHNLSVNDSVNISVVPDDLTTETTYYIRKRKYQQVKLKTPIFSSVINDTGIGRIDTLISGTDYASSTFGGATFNNVDVVFTNPDFARNAIGQTVGSAENSGATIGNEGGRDNAKATVIVGYTKTVTNFIISTNTIVLSDIENVFPGQQVKGNNIADETRVLSVNPNGSVLLTNPNTNTILLGDIDFAVFNAGVISSVEITSKGSSYRKGDLISFANSDLDKADIEITRDFIGIVDHVGFSQSDEKLLLNDVRSLSNDDLLKIGSEIVKVVSTDISSNSVIVTRGENNTPIEDHFDKSSVDLVHPQYRFNTNQQIVGTSARDPFVYDYDSENQLLTVYFNYSQSNTNNIELSTVFLDNSVPAKSVIVSSVVYTANKFEYSSDNINFEILRNLEFQKYYQYKFITEHPSMQNTYLEFSPSINKNIIALDSFRNDIPSGSAGSFIKIKPGANFGYYYNNTSIYSSDTIVNDTVIDVEEDYQVAFNRFYFFDKNDDVDTSDGFLSIVDDPLQGRKTVIFKTNDVFVYTFDKTPQFDGSGLMTYTTNGRSAVGAATSILIENAGNNYNVIPSVLGIVPSEENKASIEVTYDSLNNNIANVSVVTNGSGYSKPKAIVKGNGIDAAIELVVRDGKVFGAIVKNSGYGYTEEPEIEVIETDVNCFLSSTDIGIPESVEVTNSGFLFNTDKSHYRKYFSNTQLILNDITGNFLYGEKVVLEHNGVELASGVVTKNGWRKGTNILKLQSVTGIFIKGLTVKGKAKGSSAKIIDIFRSEFSPNVKSFYDNIGYYTSERGKIGQYTQRLTDSYFYQDYSYVIKSQTPIDLWRDLILQTTHPAGFKVFGEVIVDTKQTSSIAKAASYGFTRIDLEAPKLSNHSVTRKITQSFATTKDSNEQYGRGTVYVNSQNNAETYATEVTIQDPFDGVQDPSTGKVIGTTTFALTDKSTGLPIVPYSEEQLFVTIDGVVQEPGVAFTVSGSNIIFSEPPLGERTVESQLTPAQVFYGRSFRFKESSLNDEYIRKIRNFFQRSGRWLDSANQIKFNKDFIVEESIGYAIETYPNVPWNLYQEKCSRDIRLVLDAIEHDIRFGGNGKVYDAGNSYFTNVGALDHIDNELTESLDTFNYAAKLCSAALRNWDYTVTNAVITPSEDVITVPDTFGIVVGMNVSSGSQFPTDTKVTEVINGTQIRVSSNARVAASNTLVTTSGTVTIISVDTTVAGVINEGDIEVGTVTVVNGGTTTLTSTYSVANIPQVTFSLSKINNGTFYDASNLIEANKTYIQEETLGWVKAMYPTLNIPDETKCKRDTGFLVDAVVHNLRYGGTTKIVKFARSYYVGNTLKHINNELTESVNAFKHAVSLMVLAMRGTLPNGIYTSESPFYDTNILDDPNEYFPACAEVESTLNSYAGIIDTLLLDGIGLIQPEPENNQRSGNWTSLRTYSNYNLIPDPLLLAQECNDVVESIKSLNGVLDSVLSNGPDSVERTNPDYIDGENTLFDLYYEDGGIVKTAPTENLLVFINGIVQLYDSYDIIRSEDPNVSDKISFTEAPRWEQEENVLTVQEPLAVDKTFAIRVGSYEKAVIDNELVKIRKTGPFPLYDSNSPAEVKYIDDDRYAYVFVDGVLQQRGVSYDIAGSSITFKKPLVASVLEDGTEVVQRVDVLIFYGRDLGKKLTFFDYEPDAYKNDLIVTIEDLSGTGANIGDIFDYYFEYYSSSTFVPSNVKVYELIGGSQTNVQNIGNLKKFSLDPTGGDKIILSLSNEWNLFDLRQDSIIIFSTTATIADAIFEYNNPLVRRNRFKSIQLSPGQLEITYQYATDPDGLRYLRRDAVPRFYQILDEARSAWDLRPSPITNLRVGDEVRIDGEDQLRRIIDIPDIVKPKEYRKGKSILNEFYGEIVATNYNGFSEGRGLSALAEIDENGSISKIIWNKRDIQLFVDENYKDKQTARGYYLAPCLEFVPRDENGGGAKAEVLVVDGAVIDVIITDPGSGYTQPPRILTTRRYVRYKQTRTYTSIDYEFVYQEELRVSVPISEITVIPGGVVPIVYSYYEVLKAPVSTEREITQQINPYLDYEFVTIDVDINAGVFLFSDIDSSHDTFSWVSTQVDLEHEVAVSSDDPYRVLRREIDVYVDYDIDIVRFITSAWTTAETQQMPDAPSDTWTWIRTQLPEEVVNVSIDEQEVYRVQTGTKNILIEHDIDIVRFITSAWTTAETQQMPDAPVDTWTSILQNINKFGDVSSSETAVRMMRREVNPYVEYDIDILRVVTSSWTTASDIDSDHNTSRWSITHVHPEISSVSIDDNAASRNLKGTKNILIDYDIDVVKVVTSSWTTASDIESDHNTYSVANSFVELDKLDVSTESDDVSRIVTGVITLETSPIRARRKNNITLASTVDVATILSAPMPADADYMYALNTDNFPDQGLVLIGKEVVFYGTRDTGRFLDVVRGVNGSEVVAHDPGDYLRLIPEMVSVAPASGISEIITNITISNPIKKLSPGVNRVISTRASQVLSSSVVSTEGEVLQTSIHGMVDYNRQSDLQGDNFAQGILGSSITVLKNFRNAISLRTFGEIHVHSEYTSIDNFTWYYPTLTIADYDAPIGSTLADISGTYYNYGIPSINNPVTVSADTGIIGSTLNVENTNFFPNSGYLFTSEGTTIEYTGKTSTSFTGCTIYGGVNTITNTTLIAPFNPHYV